MVKKGRPPQTPYAQGHIEGETVRRNRCPLMGKNSAEIPPNRLTGLFWNRRLGWETSLFPPVNDKCDSRTRFSNRLGSRLVERRTPISRQLCTWRKHYSLARRVVSISEVIKFSFKMEAAKTLIVF
ncbi:hypothetical protein AVEN_138026-1 [Araneus ventricosus]|uniref:Uncharacterized protein n=1 Tax=Araneus ventricosus TaxID=182803 RepID=A0A4Y2E9J5_ARAVE|nr:hypothetical protein AVEN_138026-1 [Araneus ventricosus]